MLIRLSLIVDVHTHFIDLTVVAPSSVDVGVVSDVVGGDVVKEKEEKTATPQPKAKVAKTVAKVEIR